MKFTVDRSQAEVKPFASPGEYIVTVNSCKDDNLDKNGNPVCTLRYKGGNGEVISDRFVLKDTMMWRLQALISATEANIADGDEFDFSIGGAFFRFLQGFVGLQLVVVIEEEKYTDKNGAEQVALRVKRMKKVPVDVDDI
jgi:hypothetical protein